MLNFAYYYYYIIYFQCKCIVVINDLFIDIFFFSILNVKSLLQVALYFSNMITRLFYFIYMKQQSVFI